MSELINRKWLMDNIDDWDCDEKCEECEFIDQNFCVDKRFFANAPTIEPNLILPERMERGECYEVGETIVVMNHDDYYDLLCRAMENEPKQGEWILVCDAEGEGDNLYRCSVCGHECGCQEYDLPNYCGTCGARNERSRR